MEPDALVDFPGSYPTDAMLAEVAASISAATRAPASSDRLRLPGQRSFSTTGGCDDVGDGRVVASPTGSRRSDHTVLPVEGPHLIVRQQRFVELEDDLTGLVVPLEDHEFARRRDEDIPTHVA